MSIDLDLPVPTEAAPPPPPVPTPITPTPTSALTPIPPPALTPVPARPRFAAAQAFGAFMLLVVGQVIAGAGVMVVAMVVMLARGAKPDGPKFVQEVTSASMVPLLLVTAGASTLVVWLIARFWARDLASDRSAAGIGLVPVRRTQILGWLAIGAMAGAGYLATVMWLVPPPHNGKAGPLAEAAAAGGLSRLTWLVLALVFAPLVEEFFFRGVLLAGFAASWGTNIAAAVVTVLFVSMHLSEAWSYWPALVFITILAVAAVVARRTTGSLYPPMALHFAYNAALAVAVFSMS